jgi:methylphosphotriester-DNA--protein-cysteine methyltransferase
LCANKPADREIKYIREYYVGSKDSKLYHKHREIKYIREYYVGSKDSKLYHKPHCASVKKIKPANRRAFNTVNEVANAGYISCKIYKPPYYK